MLSCLAANPSLAALSPEEINSIARQTTVLIAPGLTPELKKEIEENRNNPLASQRNKEGVWNPGSGVIIARNGKTYYVLTVAHNFRQDLVENNQSFGIRTSDRTVHVASKVDDGRGCPLVSEPRLTSLIRFGCKPPGENVQGTDLAILSFESDRNYPVASLGDADTVKMGDTVYISGWPDPEKEVIPGQFNEDGSPKCRGKVARRQRRLAWGRVSGKLNPDLKYQGYSIFYTDNTRAGMSGGPVFDNKGKVIGSHGLGRSTKPQCGANIQPVNQSQAALESGENPTALLGKNPDFDSLNSLFSSSQNVNYFLLKLQEFGLKLPFNVDPPSAALIKRGMMPGGMQAIAQASGKVEFDALSDGFEDPNDVIDDIYGGFSSIEGRLGNCSISVNLGDRDECNSR